MATKIYCDLCGKEISPGESVGGIMRAQETFPFEPVFDRQSKVDIRKQISTEVWDLCGDCQRALWEFAEQRQRELKQTKNNRL